MSGRERASQDDDLAKAREVLSAIRLKRARLLSDRNAVRGGEKDKHYAWINVHKDRIQYFQGLGYSICNDPKIQTDYKQQDGTHRRADLILMECPKTLYEALNYAEEMEGIQGLEGAENMFLEFAERYGIPTTQDVPD